MAVIELDRRPWLTVADKIDELGWVQGTMRASDGRVCLTGAIKECSPQPGDWVIHREVATFRDHAEAWNDAPGRKQGDVTRWLRRAKPITDAELEKIFGPQWDHVVALVRRAATLTPAEWERFYSACRQAWNSPAYREARGAVVVCHGPGGAAPRALRAIVADDFIADVGSSLARRHEIGTAFTQQQYDLVVGPWVTTIAPVHPDDRAAVAA